MVDGVTNARGGTAAFLRRLLHISLGYLGGCYVAALVIVAAYAPAVSTRDPGGHAVKVLAVALMVAMVIAIAAAVPSAVMIALAERRGWSRAVLASGFGAALGAGYWLLAAAVNGSLGEALVFALAGAAGGLTYWLLALKARAAEA